MRKPEMLFANRLLGQGQNLFGIHHSVPGPSQR